MASVFYRAETDVAAPRVTVTDICSRMSMRLWDSCPRAVDWLLTRRLYASLTLREQRGLRPQCAHSLVLIFYLGGQGYRFANAALCESLACNGYVVFALDAPRVAPVVVFSMGGW